MPDDAERFPADVLCVEARYGGTEVTLIVEGELDLSGTELFWA